MNDLSEADLIERKKHELKQAIRTTLSRIQANAGDTLELSPWVQKYPWMAMGTALAAGILVASEIVPDLARHLSSEEKIAPTAPRTSSLLPSLASVFAGTATSLLKNLLDHPFQKSV